jgi:hypothetical protein
LFYKGRKRHGHRDVKFEGGADKTQGTMDVREKKKKIHYKRYQIMRRLPISISRRRGRVIVRSEKKK